MFQIQWVDPANDNTFVYTGQAFLDRVNNYTKSVGAYNEFVYLSYAAKAQDPLAG